MSNGFTFICYDDSVIGWSVTDDIRDTDWPGVLARMLYPVRRGL